MQLQFAKRGYRRREGGGLTYRSKCGRFAIYCSDQCGGVPLYPVRWLAIARGQHGESIISRHRKREAAELACEREAVQSCR